MVKKRNVFLVYLWTFLTFGIYGIYWAVKTKKEMNELGGKIPTAWLIIIPIANIYWLYKYSEAYSEKVKKDKNTILWFLLFFFVTIIMPALVQIELNKKAKKSKK